MVKKIIFMGSDPIALPLLKALRDGSCGACEIAAVFTQPDRARGRGKKVQPNEVKSWALREGIEVRQPTKMGKAARLEIEALDIDLILVMAYGHIFSQKLIDTPRLGIWNLHTSLLPKFRGASPIQAAIASGDEETGVTLMRMVRELDAGPAFDNERTPIGRTDTALDIEERLADCCVPLLQRSLPLIFAGKGKAKEQDDALASYTRKLRKEDGVLDFSLGAKTLSRRVNALFPWPGARFETDGIIVKVGLADFEDTSPREEPGSVLEGELDGLRIACSEGVLVAKRLQRPGGSMLSATDFLRGFPIEPGKRIASEPMPSFIEPEPFRG